jgi:hypothetical protein
MTLARFLGIPQTYGRVRDATSNRRGNNPNAERTPPLKRLADPANLKSDVPAIKAAAEIKAQEDQAPQKIKALKYLAMMGCGCYGGVAEAMAAALEDCTEEVRYEAARAIQSAVTGTPCATCQRTCCNKDLAVKMYERAYGRDDSGCFIEPSDRVRGVLERTLSECPPDQNDLLQEQKGVPQEVLPVDPSAPRLPELPVDPTPGIRPFQPTLAPGQDQSAADPRYRYGTAPLGFESPAAASMAASQALAQTAGSPRGNAQATMTAYSPGQQRSRMPAVELVDQMVSGEVVQGKSTRGYVRIAFPEGIKPPVGTQLTVFHEYVLGTECSGSLVIVDYEGHHAIAGPRAWDNTKVALGDTVECTVRVPVPVCPPQAAVATASPSVASAAPVVSAATAQKQPADAGRSQVTHALAVDKMPGIPAPPAPPAEAKPTGAKPSGAPTAAVVTPDRTATPKAKPAEKRAAGAAKPSPVYVAPGVVAGDQPTGGKVGAAKTSAAKAIEAKPAPAKESKEAKPVESHAKPAKELSSKAAGVFPVQPASGILSIDRSFTPGEVRLPGINNVPGATKSAVEFLRDPAVEARIH